MVDRPILFSAPMVRALLAGTKTQTRRVLKPQPELEKSGDWHVRYPGGGIMGCPDDYVARNAIFAAQYEVGNSLWVREAWRTEARYDHLKPSEVPRRRLISYEADYGDPGIPNDGCRGKYRHSRFMCRWMSRITLLVTDVRVQRLQDISEEDAVAEGIEDVTREIAPSDKSLRFWKRYKDGWWNGYVDSPTGSYASLWTEINGPGSWSEDPWVAAYTFERIEGGRP